MKDKITNKYILTVDNRVMSDSNMITILKLKAKKYIGDKRISKVTGLHTSTEVLHFENDKWIKTL